MVLPAIDTDIEKTLAEVIERAIKNGDITLGMPVKIQKPLEITIVVKVEVESTLAKHYKKQPFVKFSNCY